MGKIKLVFIVLGLLFLTACGKNLSMDIPLAELQADYNLRDAKNSDCVVFEDGDVTDGQKFWDEFLTDTENHEASKVRLVKYYTLDKDTCSEEYYESNKDDYPMMFIQDLSYDGEAYTIRWYEDGEEFVQSYKYLKKMIDEPKSESAKFLYCTQYVLLDDENITAEDIFKSLISSQSNAYIKHNTVYTDYVYDEDTNQ